MIHKKRKYKNLKGLKINKLLVLEEDLEKSAKSKQRYWKCLCDCGKTKSIRGHSISTNLTKSCGCLNKEVVSKGFKHGKYKTREYCAWSAIKQRILNKNDKRFKDYGGRGITLYEPWINSSKLFIEYVQSLDNNDKLDYSLDRIDNNGNYEPGNLR